MTTTAIPVTARRVVASMLMLGWPPSLHDRLMDVELEAPRFVHVGGLLRGYDRQDRRVGEEAGEQPHAVTIALGWFVCSEGQMGAALGHHGQSAYRDSLLPLLHFRRGSVASPRLV